MNQYKEKRIITNADPGQINRRTFEEETDSVRVHIVSGEMPNFKIPELKQQEVKIVEVPTTVIVKEPQVIETQVIVKEYEVLEVQKIVTEYKTIEIPVFTKEVEYKTIEVPVISTEVVYKDLPNYLKLALLVQALGTILLLVKSVIK